VHRLFTPNCLLAILAVLVPSGLCGQLPAWVNADSAGRTVTLSLEALAGEGGRPALENAMSRSVTTGLKPGQKDVTTFIADQAGWYWILCGVPGHALRGEWIGLKVDRAATGVEVKVK